MVNVTPTGQRAVIIRLEVRKGQLVVLTENKSGCLLDQVHPGFGIKLTASFLWPHDQRLERELVRQFGSETVLVRSQFEDRDGFELFFVNFLVGGFRS